MSDTENRQTRARHRSPAHPSISLPEAAERLKSLFRGIRRESAHLDFAVKQMGYNKSNGHTLRSVAALNQYGLIEESGKNKDRKVKISERGLAIAQLPDSDPRRSQHVKDAALTPTVFEKLWEKYGRFLPGADVIESYLTYDLKFNEASVGLVVRTYLETLDYADLNSPSESEEMADTAPPPEPESTTELPPPARESINTNPSHIASTSQLHRPVLTEVPPEIATGKNPQRKTTAAERLEIPLGNGLKATIEYPMEKSKFDRLIATLQLWEADLVSESTSPF